MSCFRISIPSRQFKISYDGRDPCYTNNLWKNKRTMIKMCCQNNEESSLPVLTMPKIHDMRSSTNLLFNGKTKERELEANDLLFYGENITKTTTLMEEIGIVRFLTGKVLLVTGATGFLAKVLVEKILRTVPDIKQIYVLIKAKNKEEAMERLKTEIMDTELFKCLRQIHGKSYEKFLLSKLVPVVGNVSESNLGMEGGLGDEVANKVDIIVNSAGNTTFDERYDVALHTNTRGPRQLMRFAKICKGLKLFLHVSTAYVNGEREGIILEKPFSIGDSIERERAACESPKRSFQLLDMESEFKIAMDARDASPHKAIAQNMKELGLERARMYGWQDTYVFTKAMGEMMIERTRGNIPVVIMRPSVIESTYREPIPGWIEGIRMLDPLFLFYGKGEITGFPANPKGVIDTVPADMVVNAMLAAMAKHGATEKPGLNVYHVASSVANPVVFQDLFSYCYEYFNSCPYIDLKRSPVLVERMKLFTSMDEFYSHIWTEAVDRSEVVVSQGKLPRRLQKLMDSVKHLASIYEPYTFYAGRFDNTNTRKLMLQMSQEEKRSFGFDVGSIDWRDYIRNVHIPGLLKNVLKGRGM